MSNLTVGSCLADISGLTNEFDRVVVSIRAAGMNRFLALIVNLVGLTLMNDALFLAMIVSCLEIGLKMIEGLFFSGLAVTLKIFGVVFAFKS